MLRMGSSAVKDHFRDAVTSVKSSLKPNFYRLHLTYFIVVILVFSGILKSSNTTGFNIKYEDALTLATSAMCGVGLNTVDLGILDGFQQAVLFVLMLIGDLTIVSQVVVWVRRYFFKKKLNELLHHSKAAERICQDIEEDSTSQGKSGNSDAQQSQIQQRQTGRKGINGSSGANQGPTQSDDSWLQGGHLSGYGGFPAPWSSRFIRTIGSYFGGRSQTETPVHHYLSFSPDLDQQGRFQNLTPKQEAELGGVEYRALVLLTWLLPFYSFFWMFLVVIVLAPYAANSHVASIIQNSQPGSLDPTWWAFFTTVSGFTNTGLTVLNQSFIPLRREYGVLVLAGCAVLAGNAFYPVFLRLFIYTLSCVVPASSRLHHSCSFLLHHPRRCYLFLFPSRNTWILFAVQVGITLSSWILWIILQLNYAPIEAIPPGERTMAGLFQSVGLRASGFYIITISELAPALQILYLVIMYISVFPILLSIRSSNIYEERSLGQTTSSAKQDSSGQGGGGGGGVSMHVRKQLAYDIWWLLLAIFLICIVERNSLASYTPGSTKSTSAPGWTTFSVIFEVVSAYGTVGLSLGVPYANYSFCGTWHTTSKLILITVMIRGRHRILPAAIDRAVLVPGEELMERLDRELASRKGLEGEEWQEGEREVRREESGRDAENDQEGEAREADPERDDG